MSAPARATLTGADVARVLANAGAFVPARATTQLLAVIITGGRLEARGTDGYAAGIDHKEAGAVGDAKAAISKADMAKLETAARACKGETVTLELSPQIASLQWAGESGEPERLSVPTMEYPAESWAMLDSLFSRDWGDSRPEFVAFDPALFARFAKVKADCDRIMDLWFSDCESPVLAKIGVSFRGLVMPLHRERATEYAPESLW